MSYYSGTDSTTVGTSYVTTAKTTQKLLTLYKTNPAAAIKIAQLFKINLPGVAIPTTETTSTDLDKYTQNLIRTLFAVEMYTFFGLSSVTNTAASGISKANATITKDIQGIKESINKALVPVSSQTGQTLGASNPVTSPMGAPAALGKSMAHLVDKVNPGFTDRLEATLKKYKADDLQHIGTNVLGGLRSLASTVDAILSVPLSIASDIYNGLMDIMKEVSSLLDNVVAGLLDLIFGPKGLLDSLVGMDTIKGLLNFVNSLAAAVGNIGGSFSGLTTVTGALGQMGRYSSVGSSALSNPTYLATSMLPPGSTQFVSGLRNPQQLVSQIVPPSINQQLGKINTLPGLGFVGNLGYGIGGGFQSIQGGILTGIVDKYESQLGVIGAQLGMPSGNKPTTDIAASYPPTIQPSSVNPNVAAVHGYPVSLTPEQDSIILPQRITDNSVKDLTSPIAPTSNNPLTINS